MGRRKKVRCKQCGTPLFYLPNNYAMGIDIVCCECADGKKKAKKKKVETKNCKFARTKKGPRPDLGKDYFRSATEANFARILVKEGVEYKFEQRTFFFNQDRYKTKPWQYTPDFEITKGNKRFPEGWYEVKGFMDANSRNKLRRFKKNYPEEAAKMIIIVYRKNDKVAVGFCEKEGYQYIPYDELTKEFSPDIPTWEG